MHQQVRSLRWLGHTWGTWLLFQRWLEASLVSTMVRPSTRLRSSQRWLATTWLSSPFPTSLSSTVVPVLVLPTPPVSSLSSKKDQTNQDIYGFWSCLVFCFLFLISVLGFLSFLKSGGCFRSLKYGWTMILFVGGILTLIFMLLMLVLFVCLCLCCYFLWYLGKFAV